MSVLELAAGAWLLVSAARIAHNLGRIANELELERGRRDARDRQFRAIASSVEGAGADVVPIDRAGKSDPPGVSA